MHRIQAHITLAMIFIIGITILSLPIMIKLKRKGKSIVRQFGYLGLFCSIFLIIFATILFVPFTLHPEQHILNVIPLNWVFEEEDVLNHFIVEIVPNTIMFIPLGIFIPIVYKNKRNLLKTIMPILLITFSVEFMQYFIGRSSDINDIITNLLGGTIGYGIFLTTNNLFKNKKWWKRLLGN